MCVFWVRGAVIKSGVSISALGQASSYKTCIGSGHSRNPLKRVERAPKDLHSHDASAREASKVFVLKLGYHEPGNQIAACALASAEVVEHTLPTDAAFKCDLDDNKGFRETGAIFVDRRNEDEELVGWSVGH